MFQLRRISPFLKKKAHLSRSLVFLSKKSVFCYKKLECVNSYFKRSKKDSRWWRGSNQVPVGYLNRVQPPACSMQNANDSADAKSWPNQEKVETPTTKLNRIFSFRIFLIEK